MAKKLAKVKALPRPRSEVELRRWCIEQALRWPWDAGRYAGAMGGGFSQPPSQPDVLKRATEIMIWVKTPA